MKGDQKEEEAPSSLEETQAVNSQERAVRENHLDENEMLETKAEMRGDEQLAQKDNHEKLRKRGFEDGKKKRKPGVPKPDVADEIGAKKKKRKRKGKHAKKTKKQQKTGPKKKSKIQMCDNKYLEKKRLQLKVKAAKLKEQSSRMKKEKRANKRKFHGKELKRKENRACSCGTSRDTECIDKWAAFTSVGLGLAPTVIKQVGKFSFSKHYTVSGQFHPRQR